MRVKINPDKEYVAEVRKKIKENGGHCACVIDFNEDNICICKEFREQMEAGVEGECHCGLYSIVKD